MKELTIEQKAKAYDKALEKSKEFYILCKKCGAKDTVDFLEDSFPELCEPDDENIRKTLLRWIQSNSYTNIAGMPIKNIIDWLEKQCESYTKRDVDDAYLKGVKDTKNEIEKQYEANYQIRKDIATFIFNSEGYLKDRTKWMDYLGMKVRIVEEQDEQKSTTEPKFKVGDWIITNKKHIWYVDETPETTSYLYRLTNQYGKVEVADFEVVDEKARLWTIQDAKDGDVLYHKAENGIEYIVMSKGLNENNNIDSYFRYNSLHGFGVDIPSVLSAKCDSITPATKEQRDTLFAKMKEAGYEWDAERKELKKIEQSKLTEFEDAVKDMMDDYRDAIDANNATTEEVKERAAYMLSLIPHKPAEWSEEDEKVWKELIEEVKDQLDSVPAPDCRDKEDEKALKQITRWLVWIKSIKERIGG